MATRLPVVLLRRLPRPHHPSRLQPPLPEPADEARHRLHRPGQSVVEQDQVAGAGLLDDRLADLRCRLALVVRRIPVARVGTVAPQGQRQALLFDDGVDAGVVGAVRRAEQHRLDADLLELLGRPPDLAPDLLVAQAEQVRVVVGVVADPVLLVGLALDDLRVGVDVGALDEERRRRVVDLQDVEELRRELGIRAVVERERDVAGRVGELLRAGRWRGLCLTGVSSSGAACGQEGRQQGQPTNRVPHTEPKRTWARPSTTRR